MNRPRSRWGIAMPGGWFDWEEDLIKRSSPESPSLTANDQQAEVLLVDARGNALVVKQPRPLGFRKP